MTTKERFLHDVRDHVLEVFHDDGVNRHIRLRRPGTMGMHFDLITWPGYLCYTGDMGTYVFRRLEDMFEFFRAPSSRHFDANPLDRIDHRYWAEKLEASDKGDGHSEFDPAAFKREITRQRRELIRDNGVHIRSGRFTTKALWESLEEIKHAADDGEARAFAAVWEWSFDFLAPQDLIRSMKRHYIRLSTDEFPRCKRYTHRFVWCCYALRWGINQYDKVNSS